MSLLVVGSVAYDSIESPFGKADDVLGGSATYFSVTASRFAEPRVVAVVGDDFRDEDIALLEGHGVDLTGVEREAGGKTFRWGGRYEDDGINRTTLYTHLNVFEHFQPKLPASYRDSEVVFLANIGPQLQLDVLEQVKAPRVVALDTMDLWINIAPDVLRQAISKVDVVFVNDAEATLLTGERMMRKAAAAILAMGPRAVVIKRGEHGAMLFTGSSVFLAPALPLEKVLDPTGAGDTFAGGFMGYLASRPSLDDETLRQAVAVGTVMASFCVESFSLDRLHALDMAEVAARLDQLAEMTHFAPPVGIGS